jgi:hypothetical protein
MEEARITVDAEQKKPTVQRRPALVPDSASTLLAMIEKVALDPHAGVEKLERLAAMYERLKAKQAELAYNASKGRILKKLAGIKIVKNRPVLSKISNGRPQKGVFEAFKYAPLEVIDKHLRPLLAEEEMDLSYSDEPCEGGGILIRGRLKHLPSGHYEGLVYAGAARHHGRQVECAGGREHQFFPAPVCRLQHLQHRRGRR